MSAAATVEPHAFAPLPAGPFGVILADPPWRFMSYSGPTIPSRRPDRLYESVSLADLKRLDVASVAARDCALYVWTFGPHLAQTLELGAAWGFKFKTDVHWWVKTRKGGWPVPGLGHWSRKQGEQVWLFTRGHPKRLSGGVEQIIYAMRGGHSEKPPELYDRIEAMVGGPRLELFARQRRAGWESWGDQIEEGGLSL
jgi:N6-adenosine-specific RNA methylase IME4